MGAGTELNSAAATSSSSSSSPAAGSKRCRDPEDEVYVDNLHSHKRYLSEIMASSLNGLTVGDHMPENPAESPGRSESMYHYLRDDMNVQYSPMSEDSDDSRFYENYGNTCSFQPESSTSPVTSPYRCQKPVGVSGAGPSSANLSHSHISASVSSTQPQPRQRSSDTEGRFPPSPSDICHSADLRRAALLRSVQMRTHPLVPSPFELQGPESTAGMDQMMKLNVDDRAYQIAECVPESTSEGELEEKSCENENSDMKSKRDQFPDG